MAVQRQREDGREKLFRDTIRMSLRGERVKVGMDWLDSISFQDAQVIYFCLPCLN